MKSSPASARSRSRALSRAAVIKSLAHPSRLLVAEALAGGERSVGDLTALVGADVSTVSKHIAILKSAGIVEGEKRGQLVLYRLRCACFADFLGCVDTIVSDRLAQVRRGASCR